MQSTGSVYLDAARPERGSLDAVTTRRRARLAAILAGIGMISVTFAALLGVTRVVAHNPQTTTGAIEQALDSPIGGEEIEAELADAIVNTLFGDEVIYSLALYGIDIETEADRIAPIVLDDPAFRSAFADVVAETHERMLLQSVDEPLDMTAITAATRTVIVRELPEADAVLPASNTLYIVPAEDIPDLTGTVDLLDRLLLVAVGGGLMLPFAWIIHPDRHRVASWVGRWLLLLALSTGCAAIAIPWIIGGSTGSNLAEIASWHLTVRLLPPAALAGIVGFGLASTAVLFKRREPASLANDVGIAAALGRFDEELSINDPASSQTELAHRGLVDVNHPLTNI